MSVISKRFAEDLSEKRMRDAYLSAQTRTKLTNQIRTLRSDRGWSQAEFAKKLGKPQSNVSRLENREYGKFNLGTLFELAATFDVALIVKFVTYEEFLCDTEKLSPAALSVRSFSRQAIADLCNEIDAGSILTTTEQILTTQAITFPIQNAFLELNQLCGIDLLAPVTQSVPHEGWVPSQYHYEPIPVGNASTYQIRLPSPQKDEIIRLRDALAKSEREKETIRAERDALQAEYDILRRLLGRGPNDNAVGGMNLPPPFIIDQRQYRV